MTRTSIKALIATGFACCLAMPAAAEKHVALVLDNGRLQTSSSEPSQTSRIAESLERIRYRVIFGRQQDQAGMRKYINDFRGALPNAEVALFYFKGVTLDASGRNLLMASNAAPGRPIEQHAVPLDEIADLMTASKANILLVDAGYSDRTAEGLAQSAGGASPAFARLRDRSKFLVAFANMPGKVGRSDAESSFAEVVASFLGSSALTSADLGRQLRNDVFERSRGSQLPWVRSDLGAVHLAALPESGTPALPETPVTPFDRGALIRSVQVELKRHQCYGGSINGNAALAHVAIEALGRTAAGRNAPAILVARAGPEEFEDWLNWIRAVQDPICAPAIVSAPPQGVRQRPAPRERVVTKPRHERYAAPRRRDQDVSHTGVIGRGKGDYFAPTNPFYSPTR